MAGEDGPGTLPVSGLDRFVAAQEGIFDRALAEIRQGRKQGHWMWFIFPQMKGLGRSGMAQHYAIGSLEEARAYLAHPVLGYRLEEAVHALLGLGSRCTAEAVLGPVDAMKLRSSLTLFVEAGAGPAFQVALDRWFAGERDPATLRLIAAS